MTLLLIISMIALSVLFVISYMRYIKSNNNIKSLDAYENYSFDEYIMLLDKKIELGNKRIEYINKNRVLYNAVNEELILVNDLIKKYESHTKATLK